MQKDELVTGYCPKQDREETIRVTYIIADATQSSFKEPMKFKCNYSRMYGPCTDCPVFDSLT